MEPTSQSVLIQDPVLSTSPVSIHALIYNVPATGHLSSSAKPPPPIVFLHYWGGSASTSHHIPPLVHEIYQQKRSAPPTMISVSFRGWGLSSRATPDIPLAYSIHAHAEDIVAVLGQFQVKQLIPTGPDGEGLFLLCGHSMGAKVALEVAAILANVHPSRAPRLRLRGILLLAPAPPGPLLISDEARAQMEHAYDSAENVRRAVRHTLAADEARRLELNGDMDMIVRDSLAGSAGAKRGWLEVGMGEDIRELLAADRKMRDGGLKVRVMVAMGDRVETAKKVEVETVELLRGTSLLGVKFRLLEPGTNSQGEDCGHLLPLEAPQQVAAELCAMLSDIA